jgi:sulfate permease, SulP family
VRLQFGSDGQFVEATAPAELASHEVTVLDVYGSLLFAGARTLQMRLPGPSGCERPVVVHGRTTLGATGFIVLADYAERLRTSGGICSSAEWRRSSSSSCSGPIESICATR